MLTKERSLALMMPRRPPSILLKNGGGQHFRRSPPRLSRCKRAECRSSVYSVSICKPLLGAQVPLESYRGRHSRRDTSPVPLFRTQHRHGSETIVISHSTVRHTWEARSAPCRRLARASRELEIYSPARHLYIIQSSARYSDGAMPGYSVRRVSLSLAGCIIILGMRYKRREGCTYR